MKLLFDQHMSFRIVRALQPLFPEARHLRFFNLVHCSDSEIWEFAKKNGYAIVTKDSDFHQSSLVFGAPPKVIWLKIGNTDRSAEESFLRDRAKLIEDFLAEKDAALLILSSVS